MSHWSYGHNVSGCLPESDVICCDSWSDARAGLLADLEYDRDSAGDMPDTDERSEALWESLGQAMRELTSAAPNATFLAYSDDGARHTIPTAWWIERCEESIYRLATESDYTLNSLARDGHGAASREILARLRAARVICGI